VEPEPTSLIVDQECSGLDERHRVRDLDHGVRVSMRGFGVATAVEAVLRNHGKDAVSNVKLAAVRRGLDFARHLGSGYEWQIRFHLVGARDLQQVEEVHRSRVDADPDQCARRGGGIDDLESKLVGRPQLTDDPRPGHRGRSYRNPIRSARRCESRE